MKRNSSYRYKVCWCCAAAVKSTAVVFIFFGVFLDDCFRTQGAHHTRMQMYNVYLFVIRVFSLRIVPFLLDELSLRYPTMMRRQVSFSVFHITCGMS